MNENERYQASTLEEKRSILEALFATYSSLVNENYHSSLDSLEKAFSLMGKNKNRAGVQEILSDYIESGEYGKVKSELEEIIHPCGFYKNKAKNAKACAQKLLSDFDGIVPKTLEELITLPGVGRKSANVILLEVFGIANGIAVDTHAKRISNKIGLSKQSDPEKIEQDLLKRIPKEMYYDVNHLLVWHGRNVCTARNPKCDKCPINKYCDEYKK